MAFPTDRPRRLRRNEAMRSFVRETRLSPEGFVNIGPATSLLLSHRSMADMLLRRASSAGHSWRNSTIHSFLSGCTTESSNMIANIVLEFFLRGGPVMWPILICALVAVAVVGERAFWWMRERGRRDPRKLEQILAGIKRIPGVFDIERVYNV